MFTPVKSEEATMTMTKQQTVCHLNE